MRRRALWQRNAKSCDCELRDCESRDCESRNGELRNRELRNDGPRFTWKRFVAWQVVFVAVTVLLPGCAWRREPSSATARSDGSPGLGWLTSRGPSWGWLSSDRRGGGSASAGVAGASSAAAPVDSQLAPTDAAALCLATAQQFEQGNRPVEAVAQYERVLSLQPDMPGVSARLAVLHGRLANHELASRHFQKALAQSPRDGRLWNDFGYHHYQNGRWSEAERAFRESCRLDPKLERNQVNLGLALAQQNRLGEAFEAFTKAVSPGAAHSNIGMVLAQQGRSAEALDAFQRALDSEPNLHQTQVARDVVARQGKTGGLILPASHTEMAAPEMPAPAAPGMAGPIAPAVPGMAAPMAPAAPGMAAPGMAAPGMAAPGMAGPGMAAPTAPGPHRFPPTGDFAPAGR